MHIDVRYVANLARLSVSDEEVTHFQAQLDQILEYVRKIGEVDVSEVEPTAHAAVVENVFRDDVTREGLATSLAMGNAPEAAQDQFVVPRIVE
jgi:aspartyl-tRNA(Asn)/glutamyl-tRNA(Gln) amidotransferase subunit C